MKIMVISHSWPSNERSGVSLAAATHVKMLAELGHEVSIIGADSRIIYEKLPASHKAWIRASGSGALYSRSKVDKQELKRAILKINPHLILVEAWQTALTDEAIEVGFDLGINVLMISHGISLHPYQNTVTQIIRSLAWLPYRYFRLPSLLKKISAITVLDEHAISNRFLDRDLAKKMGIKIFPLKNAPINFVSSPLPRCKRINQVLVVGYFSAVKNQIGAIRVFSKLPKNLRLCFVGKQNGGYYDSCRSLVSHLGLEKRVSFLQDFECNLALEIARSVVVYSPSITEVLPMVLIEAMACGTPFVATNVGAVKSLCGGILANTKNEQIKAINKLIKNNIFWESIAQKGLSDYFMSFTDSHIKDQLSAAVTGTARLGISSSPVKKF